MHCGQDNKCSAGRSYMGYVATDSIMHRNLYGGRLSSFPARPLSVSRFRTSGGEKEEYVPTFSFRCRMSTIDASSTIAIATVSVTRGIHSPGLRYNSFLQSVLCESSDGGTIRTFEFGITPSMLMKCSSWCFVEPTKKFSM